MRPARKARRVAVRGYTLVEVLVALAVLAVGITGILALQNASIIANRRGQEMTLATNLARRWMERLRTDALTWNRPSLRQSGSDLAGDTAYLCTIVGCTVTGTPARVNQWFVPPTVGSAQPGFDNFGNDVPVTSTGLKYCTNVRLSWMANPDPARQGVLRAEVRIWWYREGAVRNMQYASCGLTAAALDSLGGDISNVAQVYVADAITGSPL